MKAIVQHRYGSPDGLVVEDVDRPVAKDNEILVRVRAASVNPYDWHHVTGTPYIVRTQAGLLKPKEMVRGLDLAGRVESVGRGVTAFQPGDEVFGMGRGAYAEYVCIPADGMVLKKPAGLTFEQAAATPMAALSALQGLRDKGQIRPGQRVLVNGASGGVGTFAVQIAKAFGADVTAVCRTRNVDLVRSLGADRVIDYASEDFTRDGRQYDLILDTVGSRSFADCRRAMSVDGKLVAVGGPKKNRWIGPLASVPAMLLVSRFGSRKMIPMLTRNSIVDLTVISKLLEAGTVTPVIDRRYPLIEAAEAMRYVGQGHSRGKVVLTVDDTSPNADI